MESWSLRVCIRGGEGLSPTAAKERKAAERARKRQAGMKPYEVWLTAAEHKWFVAALAKRRNAK